MFGAFSSLPPDALRVRGAPGSAQPRRSHLAIAFAAVVLSAIIIQHNFPGPAGYFTSADEGFYYRYAASVHSQGWSGLKENADEFVRNTSWHVFPLPTRLLSTLTNACALAVADSYESLSVMSLIWFTLLLIISWHYLCRIWSEDVALTAVLLLAFSPLLMALATHALIDSLSSLLIGWALLSFLAFLVGEDRRDFITFSVAIALNLLNRESTLLLCPFFLGALLYVKHHRQLRISYRSISLAVTAITVAVGLIMLSAYGLQNLSNVARTFYEAQIQHHDAYPMAFNNGPWYRYLLDLLLLSPLTLLLSLFYCGHYLLSRARDLRVGVLISLFCYVLLVFALTYKNIRYVTVLDIEVRLLAALGILQLTGSRITAVRPRKLAAWSIVLLLIASDVRGFHRYFVTGKIYDPVSYNFLEIERFIPSLPPGSAQ
ncbi:MAG: glycosyltransferase family 39 protein [Acidobacteriota bacterium]